jgi:hypothetical protein
MLAYSDKWWMISWNALHLSKLGHRKREEQSCVPVQMREERWYSFSVERESSCQCFKGSQLNNIQTASIAMELITRRFHWPELGIEKAST